MRLFQSLKEGMTMGIQRQDEFSIEALELLIQCAQKPYVSYVEGAKLYSLGRNSFIELAQEAKAVRKIGGRAIVNVQKLNEYIEDMYG